MVFICHSLTVPIGVAGSNRIKGIAQALNHAQDEVCILGAMNCTKDEQYEYDGIKYVNLYRGYKNLIEKKAAFWLGAGLLVRFIKCFRQKHPNERIHVILYSQDVRFVTRFFMTKNNIDLIIDVVEWYDENDLMGFSRFSFFAIFYHLAPKCRIISIGEYIADHFRELGVDTLVLPPIIDTRPQCEIAYAAYDKISLIYNGRLASKDNVRSILWALTKMSPEQLKRIEIIITGETKEKILNVCEMDEATFLKIKDVLYLPGWISYEEMVQLLQGAAFGIMVRNYSRTTQANFPSKIPELMSYGRPIITNVTGDIGHYLVHGENAIIMSDNSADAVENALEQVLHMSYDELMQMQRNAKVTATERFDYRQWAGALSSWINN